MADYVHRLDTLIGLVGSKDMKEKIQGCTELLTAIEHGDLPVKVFDDEAMGRLVDSLQAVSKTSNFKASQLALDSLAAVCTRVGDAFNHHHLPITPAIIERLGDAKQPVRDAAQSLLQAMMDSCGSVQSVMDRIKPAFSHKNPKVREGALVCICRTLGREDGCGDLKVSPLLTPVCTLLEDSQQPVREQAIQTLVELYRSVGERIRDDITKRGLQKSRLAIVLERLDAAAAEGPIGDGRASPVQQQSAPRTKSAPAPAKASAPPARQNSLPGPSQAPTSAAPPLDRQASIASNGSALDSEFVDAADECAAVRVHSDKELDGELMRIGSTIADQNVEWERRIKSTKRLRSLVNGGAANMDCFVPLLKQHAGATLAAMAVDLRSAVQRDACVTIAHLARVLESRLEPMCESLAPALLKMTCSTVKIMAENAHCCLRQLAANTPSQRSLKMFCDSLTDSKSVMLRTRAAEYLTIALRDWDISQLERSGAMLETVIRKGLGDADGGVRTQSRRAYWAFFAIMQDRATAVAATLDASAEKLLIEERKKMSTDGDKASHVRAPSATRPARTGAVTSAPPAMQRHASQPALSQQQRAALDAPTAPPKKAGVASGAVRLNVQSGAQSQPNLTAVVTPAKEDVQRRTAMLRPMATAGLAGGAKRAGPSTETPPPGILSLLHRNPRLNSAGSTGREANVQSAEASADESDSDARSVDRQSPTRMLSESGQGPSIATMLQRLASDQWADRMQALGSLRARIARASNSPSVAEIESICHSLARRVDIEKHPKVLASALDALLDLIQSFREALLPIAVSGERPWMDFMLAALFLRQSQEPGAEVDGRIERIVDTFRSTFPYSDQLQSCFRLLADADSNPRTRDIVARTFLLDHALAVLPKAPAAALSAESSLASEGVARIVAMTGDPRSKDFRSMAEDVLVAMYRVNPPAFNTIVRSLPSAEAAGAADVLSAHLPTWQLGNGSAAASGTQSVHDNADDDDHDDDAMNDDVSDHHRRMDARPSSSLSSRGVTSHVADSESDGDDAEPASPPRDVESTPRVAKYSPSHYARPPSATSETAARGTPSSAHRASSRALSGRTPSRAYEMEAGSRPVSSSSSTASRTLFGADAAAAQGMPVGVSSSRSASEMGDHSSMASPALDFYAPAPHAPSSASKEQPRSALSSLPAMVSRRIGQQTQGYPTGGGLSPATVSVPSLLARLAAPEENSTPKEREDALNKLAKASRENDERTWEKHFAAAFAIALDHLRAIEGGVRTAALRLLREMFRNQCDAMADKISIVLPRLLEMHSDREREVLRWAEEVTVSASEVVSPMECIAVINPTIASSDGAPMLAAIKLLTRLLAQLAPESLEEALPLVLPGLFRGYRHSAAEMRKAAVFCLVEMHLVLGDALLPSLAELSTSQMRLLTIYINRAKTKAGADGTVPEDTVGGSGPQYAPSSSIYV